MPQYSLHALLSQAVAMYRAEIPELQHSVALTDEGGAPVMAGQAKSYLGLQGGRPEWCKSPKGAEAKRRHDECRNSSVGCLVQPDDFVRRAWGRDEDGYLRTPLHAALTRIKAPKLRHLLQDVLPEVYFPSEILALNGYTEHWEQNAILREALTILAREYRDLDRVRPRKTAWTDLSSSQQAAIEAGEKAAA
jgi:hypothetical protein